MIRGSSSPSPSDSPVRALGDGEPIPLPEAGQMDTGDPFEAIEVLRGGAQREDECAVVAGQLDDAGHRALEVEGQQAGSGVIVPTRRDLTAHMGDELTSVPGGPVRWHMRDGAMTEDRGLG